MPANDKASPFPRRPLYHCSRVWFTRSRRGHWWWHWEDRFLGHTTTEEAGGFATRDDCVIAFCLTADARGFSELAAKIGRRQWESDNG